jgi:hypothetical protein
MRKITFGLIALVSLALGSAVFAEVDEAHNLVTGTVVSVDVGYMEIDIHEANATNFGVFVEKWGSYKPKVGDNVRVHIRQGGRRVYADKIEKVGTANKGSKKN